MFSTNFLLMKIKIFKLEDLMFERLLLLSTSFPWSTLILQSYKNEIRMTCYRQLACSYPPRRTFTHVFIVWGSSSRKEILYGVGRATDSIMGVCRYPGRCYHSEACMAGVGNDVTRRLTAPPLEIRPYCPFIWTSMHRENFLYTDTCYSVSVNAHDDCCRTNNLCRK